MLCVMSMQNINVSQIFNVSGCRDVQAATVTLEIALTHISIIINNNKVKLARNTAECA